jgi:hypothetical protein
MCNDRISSISSEGMACVRLMKNHVLTDVNCTGLRDGRHSIEGSIGGAGMDISNLSFNQFQKNLQNSAQNFCKFVQKVWILRKFLCCGGRLKFIAVCRLGDRDSCRYQITWRWGSEAMKLNKDVWMQSMRYGSLIIPLGFLGGWFFHEYRTDVEHEKAYVDAQVQKRLGQAASKPDTS